MGFWLRWVWPVWPCDCQQLLARLGCYSQTAIKSVRNTPSAKCYLVVKVRREDIQSFLHVYILSDVDHIALQKCYFVAFLDISNTVAVDTDGGRVAMSQWSHKARVPAIYIR